MGAKKKIQRNSLLSSIITLVSFLYKALLAYLNTSLVLFVACISTLMVFICKVLFVKNVTKSRSNKKKAYFFMILSIFVYSLIFTLFAVLKVMNIDISRQVEFDGLYGLLFIALLLILFVLSIINLKGALEKTDLMVIGLKEMTFISALADLVIIEKYLSLLISKYVSFDYYELINGYFALGICGIMFITSIIMFIRFTRYLVEN